ncbi:RES family NAD+ phosphorylase [Paraburkholderia fungorum]|uniref:RES family NAD+ phosphorylase n=1 Tax=Paraburkholderia fungorum TaxID=134537 RepID=UPI001608626E|nr:RES family NAD+ phosphorylase [Paraburkholderia fungorum]MBB5547645.1 RES domain-containing protein [Paraburkholderia fungorum]
MKVIRLQGTAYRVLSPKWAFQPTSGRGAGTHGGRANRPGVDAIYLSLDTETALAEYKQTSDLLMPGLIASYSLDIGSVVDITAGPPVEDDPLWDDFWLFQKWSG